MPQNFYDIYQQRKENRMFVEKEKAKHKARLEKDNGLIGHIKADQLYQLAWDYGHADGVHDVEAFYVEMAVLLDA